MLVDQQSRQEGDAAPNPWFGPAVSHYIMDDLIPEGWIEI